MDFKFVDIENLKEEELIEILNHNRKTNSLLKSKIEKLKQASKSIKEKEKIKDERVKVKEQPKDNKDDEFEEEIDYYLNSLLELDKDNIDDIESVIPNYNNPKFKKIVMRLLAELNQEQNELKDLIFSNPNASEDDIKSLKEDIEFLNYKKSLLTNYLNEDVLSEIRKNKTENKLLFIPTPYGNIRALEEIKNIPQEYYSNFLELFESIQNGTFKGVKRFTNNSALKGACEVRGDKTRIVFIKLSKDCYGILTAFVKKTQNDNGYRTSLKNKMAEYRKISDWYKETFDTEESLEENKIITEELFSILGKDINEMEDEFLDDKTRTSR